MGAFVFFLFFIVKPCLVNATILSVIDPTSEIDLTQNHQRRFAVVEIAQNEQEGLLIAYKARKKSALTVTVTPSTSDYLVDSTHRVDARWLIPWYQAQLAGKSVWKKQGRKLVKELLVKNPHLIKIDESLKKNYVLAGEQYVDISKIKTDASRVTSIHAQYYPIQDSSTLLPYQVNENQRVDLYLLFEGHHDAKQGGNFYVIHFRENGIITDSLTLKVNVLPFMLRNSMVTHAIYYRGKLTDKHSSYLSSEWKTEQQIKAEFSNLRAHGITQVTTYQGSQHRFRYRKYFELLESSGLTSDFVFYLGKMLQPNVNTRPYTENYLKAKELSKGAKVYIYAIDEAQGDSIDRQYTYWEELKNEGFGIIAAGRKEYVEKMAGHVDIFVAAYEPEVTVAKAMHNSAGKIYVYANPQAGVENPLIYRKNYGFLLWQNDYDGAMTYAYQHTEGYNIWDDFDSEQYRDHVFAYPTVDGVIDTIAWEGYREAVDDLRYLATFQQLMEDFTDKVDNTAAHLEYRHWLAKLKKAKSIDSFAVRKELAKKIEALIIKGMKVND